MRSVNGWRHFERGVDTTVVIVVDVAVDGLDHLTSRLESVEVAQLVFETSIERLNVAILPRRCHVTDRDLGTTRFENIGTALCHEFSALVGVKDERRYPRCESLVEGR